MNRSEILILKYSKVYIQGKRGENPIQKIKIMQILKESHDSE